MDRKSRLLPGTGYSLALDCHNWLHEKQEVAASPGRAVRRHKHRSRTSVASVGRGPHHKWQQTLATFPSSPSSGRQCFTLAWDGLDLHLAFALLPQHPGITTEARVLSRQRHAARRRAGRSWTAHSARQDLPAPSRPAMPGRG